MKLSPKSRTILISLVLLSGCHSTPEVPVRESAEEVPVVHTTIARRPAADGPEEEGVTGADRSGNVDPFSVLENLWENGRIEEAREFFWEDEIRSLADREEETWSMWRGRLFLQAWKGSALGLAGENISALLVDGDDVWAGTWTGGLTRYSVPLDNTEVSDAGIPSLAVRTVNRIRRTDDGVSVIRYGAMESYSYRSSTWRKNTRLPVNERLQDHLSVGGREYLGSLGEGLWVREDRQWERLLNAGLFINRIEKGPGDKIVIATMDRGVYIHDTSTGEWKRPDDVRIRNANVTSVALHGGMIICGTYGSGAFYWDPESGDAEYFDSDIITDQWVLAVLSEGSRVYFGTFGAGLASWNTETGTWNNLGISEGMPIGDIASLAAGNDGSVWAGTLGGGLVRIDRRIHGD